MTIIRKETIALNQEEKRAFEIVLDICAKIGYNSDDSDLRTLANCAHDNLVDLWDMGEFEE